MGLACLTTLIGALAGMPAAITAASGAATTSVADTVCAPRAKPLQMVPAVLGTLLVSALVALSHTSTLWLTVVILLTIFTSIFWMSWGKRGGPQTFVMVLTLVFQMAAFSHSPMTGAQIWHHLGWVAIGSVGMALWSGLSIRVLAARYRTLALSDCMTALAAMMRAQAQWTRRQPANADKPEADTLLLALIAQQAGASEIFQAARDLLYSQADTAAPIDMAPITQQQIHALVHTINLRDVVLACQLDLDQLPDTPDTANAIQALASDLDRLADELTLAALRWQQGLPPNPGAQAAMSPQMPKLPETASRIDASLQRRRQHMHALTALIVRPESHTAAEGMNAQLATTLGTLVSPNNWTLPPLKAQLGMQSTVMRYALRATMAVACADAIAHILPWTSHPHWILMTVAVVMRGNLEQTLARRDARVQGTLIGCLLASGLLTWADHSIWLFLSLAISLSLAHGFVLINYRVTAAAGAVLALVQGHLFTPTHHPALIDAAERLGDTLIGAALAWAFSYVLPAWEQRQLPRLAGRLLRAQAHYAHHALHWHEAHERSHLRSHARRDVYEVLGLLSQSLQRMGKEPRQARRWAPDLETMLIHSQRLTSHLAAIKGLLTVRHDDLIAQQAGPALQTTEARIRAAFKGERLAPEQPPDQVMTDPMAGDEALLAEDKLPPDASRQALTDWLLLRLAQTRREAGLMAEAAHALRRETTG